MKRKFITFLALAVMVTSIGVVLNSAPIPVALAAGETKITHTATIVNTWTPSAYMHVFAFTKVDDIGQPMPGVSLGLWSGGVSLENVVTQSNGQVVFDGNGPMTGPGYPAGVYEVRESTVPAGYTADPRMPMTITATDPVSVRPTP